MHTSKIPSDYFQFTKELVQEESKKDYIFSTEYINAIESRLESQISEAGNEITDMTYKQYEEYMDRVNEIEQLGVEIEELRQDLEEIKRYQELQKQDSDQYAKENDLILKPIQDVENTLKKLSSRYYTLKRLNRDMESKVHSDNISVVYYAKKKFRDFEKSKSNSKQQ